MHIIIVAVFILFSTASTAISAITFTNGKWETTFDCPEWTTYAQPLTCDGIEPSGAWTTTDGSYEQIVSAANNSSGGGGRGQRHFIGDGVANNSGGTTVIFPTPQQEFWVRFYMRIEEGAYWSEITTMKLLYIYNSGTATQVIPVFYGFDEMQLNTQGTGTDTNQLTTTTTGWDVINGGRYGDGQWHCYEFYLKVDSNGESGSIGDANGIGRIWIDGVLQENNTNVNFSWGDSAAKQGWTYFKVGSNGKTSATGRDTAYDYDDMIVYNTTPPSVDAEGNPFIGPISFSTPVDGVCGSADGESFSEAPTTNLCIAGTDGTVSGDGPWTWACNGTNGGSNASCSATLLSSVVNWLTSGESNIVITDPATGNAIRPPQ